MPLDRIEDIVGGCVNVAHEGMGDIARWAALAAGFPDSVPAVTREPLLCIVADRRCLYLACDPGRASSPVGIAGGVESMSRSGWAFMKGDAPFLLRGPDLHARHDVGGCRRSAEPYSARAQCLRRDDQDRTERGRPVLS